MASSNSDSNGNDASDNDYKKAEGADAAADHKTARVATEEQRHFRAAAFV
jgi:hypothetical protein